MASKNNYIIHESCPHYSRISLGLIGWSENSWNNGRVSRGRSRNFKSEGSSGNFLERGGSTTFSGKICIRNKQKNFKGSGLPGSVPGFPELIEFLKQSGCRNENLTLKISGHYTATFNKIIQGTGLLRSDEFWGFKKIGMSKTIARKIIIKDRYSHQ